MKLIQNLKIFLIVVKIPFLLLSSSLLSTLTSDFSFFLTLSTKLGGALSEKLASGDPDSRLLWQMIVSLSEIRE